MTHKILIVGHPQSGLETLEALLHAAGLARPHASRREGLTPQQIDATLLQSHRQPGLGQRQVGAVWQGLALDLLMANLDQPTWGWHDPDALPLLDFWCAVDPDLRVVLTYDRPDSVLTQLSAGEALALTPAALDQRLDDWAAYQEAALHFAYRHRDRCLLVHAERVRQTPHELVEPLGRIAPAAWVVPAGWQAPTPAAGAALTAWLARTPVEASARATALYEEWQAVADLPAVDAPSAAAPAERADVASAQWLPAWQAWAERTVELAHRDDELARRTIALKALEQQALLREQGLRAELTQLRTTHRQQRDESRAQHERDAADAQHKLQQAHDEAAMLLAQLHRVQDSCEALHLERQRDAELCQQLQALQAQIATLKQDAARGVTERHVHAAREAAQRAELESAVRQVEQENALLLSQLHRVQEALEHLHLERTPKPAAPCKPVPYGAADRIKQQLSYRLGAKMIEQSGSLGGWMSMPWALKRVHADYRKEVAQRGDRKLPPLHTYGDTHEAERVKQHLSYRLGQTLIRHGQSPLGWLALPVALGREVKTFRRAREQVAA